MKTLTTKVALSALAMTALIASPAFARSHRVVLQDNASGVYDVAPGTAYAAPGNDIPGYASDGSVTGIANPDQYGAWSQR
jgi:hypothetical protein